MTPHVLKRTPLCLTPIRAIEWCGGVANRDETRRDESNHDWHALTGTPHNMRLDDDGRGKGTQSKARRPAYDARELHQLPGLRVRRPLEVKVTVGSAVAVGDNLGSWLRSRTPWRATLAKGPPPSLDGASRPFTPLRCRSSAFVACRRCSCLRRRRGGGRDEPPIDGDRPPSSPFVPSPSLSSSPARKTKAPLRARLPPACPCSGSSSSAADASLLRRRHGGCSCSCC